MGLYGSPDLSGKSEDPAYSKYMIYCSYCGMRYSKYARKKCPECGKKHAQPFWHKWWFWLIIAVMFLCAAGGNINQQKEQPTGDTGVVVSNQNTISETEQIPEEEYKASCEAYSYADIARNPGNFTGKKAVFTGKVIQMQESGKYVQMRVSVTKGAYDIWDDTLYVEYRRKTDNESRILEDDIITMYGEIKGIKTYKAVLGNQVSLPHIVAQYIELN